MSVSVQIAHPSLVALPPPAAVCLWSSYTIRTWISLLTFQATLASALSSSSCSLSGNVACVAVQLYDLTALCYPILLSGVHCVWFL